MLHVFPAGTRFAQFRAVFLLAFSLAILFAPSTTPAATSHAHDVAILDQTLAGVAPGKTTVMVGDMVFKVTVLKQWRDHLAGVAATGITKDSAFAGGVVTWPGGVVPYAFDASVVSAVHRQAFIDAAAEWTAWANVKFVARTSEASYVTVKEVVGLSGGNSAVGVVPVASQIINIGATSWNRGTLTHEIGHTLGLVHEHQRSDRDAHVQIIWANISGGMSNGNFVLLPDSQNKGAYDFYSVMHYARNALSTSSDPAVNTIVPQTSPTDYSQYLNIMGNNADRPLSTLDRAGMAMVYGAPLVTPGAVVTNTNDSGAGTLRTSIYYAVDHPGTSVSFHIPATDAHYSGGVFTINATDQLPRLGTGTTIDGTTQTAFTGDTNAAGPEVLINGANVPTPDSFADGIKMTEANCTVKGLTIHGFVLDGVHITGSGATGNSVSGCYIGTDATGTTAVQNQNVGVEIDNGATGNVIGGTTAAAGNVISGSPKQGLLIHDLGTTNNAVRGNYIGLNATGSAALANAAAGVQIFGGAQGNVIGGAASGARNFISGNTKQGVAISDSGTTGNLVQGNYIGTNHDGSASIPNGWAGVNVFGGAQMNTIGGTTAGAGNVLSGNGLQGVAISGSGTNNNVIQGNLIGTDATGANSVANGTFVTPASGIDIFAGAQGTIIGGSSAGAGNVISGNSGGGITISQPGTNNSVISGNYIGLNSAGTAALANGYPTKTATGIAIFNQITGTTVGGTAPGARNVISGNTSDGIFIGYVGTTGNLVQSNYIGLGADGVAAVPNGGNGVQIYVGASSTTVGGTSGARNVIANNANYGIVVNGDPTTLNNVIQGNSIGVNAIGGAAGNTRSGVAVWGGAQGTQIGGTAVGASNIIANNLLRGVEIDDATTINNPIRANSIFGNQNYGVALYSSGNNSRAHPTLSTAVLGVGTTVSGSLTSVASTTFQIDFFASATADASGFGQGATYLGTTSVTTNAAGTAAISATLAASVPQNYVVSATATDPSGNTSDFSNAVTVTTTDTDGDGIPDAWMIAKFGHATGLASDKSRAADDADGDGFTNLQEFKAGTDPKSAASRPRISQIVKSGADIQLTLPTVSGITYRIERKSDLGASTWTPLWDQVLGIGAALQFTDPGASALSRRFYRATVEP